MSASETTHPLYWLSVALAVTLGCHDGEREPAPLGFLCDATEDCEAPLVCVLDRCRSECGSDNDCDGGSCLASPGDPDVRGCALTSEIDCEGGSCPSGTSCDPDGRCRNECGESSDCGEERWCVDELCFDCSPTADDEICCDGVDNDCDLATPDLCDDDDDGFPCDCDDSDPDVNPGEEEVPGDGVDQDCDGVDGCRDLNCNGHTDLVVARSRWGSTGGFDTQSFVQWDPAILQDIPSEISTDGPMDVEIGDLDGDGFLDIVFANYQTDTGREPAESSYIYWGDGTISGFRGTTPTELPTRGPRQVEIADLDDDGCLDLLFPHFCTEDCDEPAFIYWGSAEGYSEDDRSEIEAERAYDGAAGDLNGDGLTDLILANYRGNASYIYWGREGGFASDDRRSLPTATAYAVEVADLNADGFPDLVFGLGREPANRIYWGGPDGPTGEDFQDLPNLPDTRALAVGDFDGDGFLDVGFANNALAPTEVQKTRIYFGADEGFHESRFVEIDSIHGLGTFAGDVDGDGIDEFALAGGTLTYSERHPGAWLYWGNADREAFIEDPSEYGLALGSAVAGAGPFIDVPRSTSCRPR